jgi:DNA segregation ATPase FtsK/SpoIIIE, S-DNA-T family
MSAKSNIDTCRSLAVTTITSYLPECDGPFPGIPYATIGNLFHKICGSLLSGLSTDANLWAKQKSELRPIDQATVPALRDKTIQPMRSFIYDYILKQRGFKKFHELDPEAMLELWGAIETLLVELVNTFFAAVTKKKGLESVLLGYETNLTWPVNLDGTPLIVKGKYDLLLYDHRFDTPHLIDFKLCGVKKDLASLTQVMLYALMLNHERGIEAGATVLNLYPQRSPITVGWEQIRAYEPALLSFIQAVAAREFPDSVVAPKHIPDPQAELTAPLTPFETPELLTDGRHKLEIVMSKLKDFNLSMHPFEEKGGSVIVGPAFTILRVVPGPGVKVASVVTRSADLQVALACETSPRIEQGAGFVGIEVPRAERSALELLDIQPEKSRPSISSFILGVDISGHIVWGDFAKSATCHMLVGGQTGSGKSEFLRQVLCSLAMSSRPQELRIIIVDPKMADYQDFNGSPYLERPVVDSMDLAVEILTGLVDEMEDRYSLFAQQKAKDLEAYNSLRGVDVLPRIVLTFDEFADAMAHNDLKKQIESSLKRLGAKARAAGIHLIIATQSPRKEVVTGLIKANLPCAVALQVANGTESKIVLDSMGAEKLLGKGDLLARFGGKTMRLQSPYADSRAVKAVMFL